MRIRRRIRQALTIICRFFCNTSGKCVCKQGLGSGLPHRVTTWEGVGGRRHNIGGVSRRQCSIFASCREKSTQGHGRSESSLSLPYWVLRGRNYDHEIHSQLLLVGTKFKPCHWSWHRPIILFLYQQLQPLPIFTTTPHPSILWYFSARPL